ncbi:hypothetical protein BLNAU_15878 [Blattamonas nauphoetae]|uniref:Uncharacterized protein n=1 Tax=Blattamonas nauphoetae TaxID=2049346 RepID=A0ABQ9XEW1_9EUKA|nr:hypothetical protein BLNAU_15878 [Blattamonas nauphoetae]
MSLLHHQALIHRHPHSTNLKSIFHTPHRNHIPALHLNHHAIASIHQNVKTSPNFTRRVNSAHRFKAMRTSPMTAEWKCRKKRAKPTSVLMLWSGRQLRWMWPSSQIAQETRILRRKGLQKMSFPKPKIFHRLSSS